MSDASLSKSDICDALSRASQTELIAEVRSVICNDPYAHISQQFPGMPTEVGLSTYSRRARLNAMRNYGMRGFEDLIVGLINTPEGKIDIVELVGGTDQRYRVFVGAANRDLVGVLKLVRLPSVDDIS